MIMKFQTIIINSIAKAWKILASKREAPLGDENSEHHWPEYLNNETGDEITICIKCRTFFYGYGWRLKCYKCYDH